MIPSPKKGHQIDQMMPQTLEQHVEGNVIVPARNLRHILQSPGGENQLRRRAVRHSWDPKIPRRELVPRCFPALTLQHVTSHMLCVTASLLAGGV